MPNKENLLNAFASFLAELERQASCPEEIEQAVMRLLVSEGHDPEDALADLGDLKQATRDLELRIDDLESDLEGNPQGYLTEDDLEMSEYVLYEDLGREIENGFSASLEDWIDSGDFDDALADSSVIHEIYATLEARDRIANVERLEHRIKMLDGRLAMFEALEILENVKEGL